jgi:hypothetical protein
MKRFSHLSFRWTLAALVLVLALPLVVFADQVVNNIDTTIDSALETKTITAGSSGTVGFYIQPSNTIPPGDASGCNATGANPATVNLSVPGGVTASSNSLTFTGCGVVQNVSFSSSTVDSYTISVASVTGGKSGSLWDTAPAAFTLIVNPPSDTTPPVITPNVSGTLGDNGWYVSDVSVSWTVTDPESAITSKTGCDPTTINYDTAGVLLTCIATSAGGTNSQSVTITRDATPPTISGVASPAPNAAGWNNTNVSVSFTCNDSLSGVASCGPNQTLSSEGTSQSAMGTAIDNAGNSASTTVSGINIDKTAPTFGACPVGGPFLLNSGLQSVGPIAVDAAISGLNAGLSTLSGSVDTSSIGTKSVTFTAVDNAGNTETKDCSYSVIYNWNGFFRPVDNLPTLNVAKAGSAIPVKFSLSGNQGLSIFAAGYPLSQKIVCDTAAPADGIEETVTAGGSSLNYDASADQYIYVWKTDKTWANSCRQLVVRLNDGTEHGANFKFSK